MNQGRENRSLVLNRETKWKIFVLNGVNLWRSRRQTSTQTFLECPPFPPPPQGMDLLRLDCEQSLFFFRFSRGRARARERRAEWRGRQPAARLAPSVTRVVICVSRAFSSTDQEKRETARSLHLNRITKPITSKCGEKHKYIKSNCIFVFFTISQGTGHFHFHFPLHNFQWPSTFLSLHKVMWPPKSVLMKRHDPSSITEKKR